MSTPVPNYLRLHRGDEAPAAQVDQRSSADQFWSAFSAATGWRIDRKHGEEQVRVLPAIEMDLMAGDPEDLSPMVVKENAAELAQKASLMTKELSELRSIVKQQEIQLAAGAATQFSPSRIESASETIHRTLQRAMAAGGFQAAAIYMLDDDTQYLNTRAVVGLPEDRLASEPRSLRGSRADLEAMVQDAVLMDDLQGELRETWNAPEQAGSAVCTALYKGDLPIGTLWLFSDEARELGEAHVAIAQMTSTQITMELTSAAQDRSQEREKKSSAAVNAVASWQYTSLPVGNHLAPSWHVDGMIESPNAWAVGWHLWDVLPDGTLMLAMAEAAEENAAGAMIATSARAALAAHSGYRHTPAQMLQRIADTLWHTNTAEQLTSLLYMHIDPETGEGQIASSGSLFGMIAGRYGYRPLVHANSRPLASSFEVDCFESSFHLEPGESLLTYGPGIGRDGIGQDLIGCCMRSAVQTDQDPLTLLRREMAGFPNRHERGMLCLSRLKD